MQRRAARTIGVAVAAVLLAGCVPDTDGPAAPRGPRALTPLAPSGFAAIWVNSDFQPIGQPTAIGSAVVGLVARDGFLFLIGIDAASGHLRWARRVTVPWMITRGDPVHVVPIGGSKVAYFEAVRSPDIYWHREALHRLVVSDATTGAQVASSPPGEFYSWPYECANGRDACIISHGVRARQEYEFRLETASDRFVNDGDSLPYATRVLERHGLLDLTDRPGNTMAWVRDGKVRWRLPMAAAFPPGFTSDSGWHWALLADQRVLVGSVYAAFPYGEPTVRLDLARTMASAGIAVATGEVAWRDAGSEFECGDNMPGAAVRCRSRGVAIYQQSSRLESFEGLDVTVEGFDPATGKTTWSVPLGNSPSLVTDRASRAIAGPAQILVETGSGPVVLDYAAGTTAPPTPGTTYWCLTRNHYQLAHDSRDRPGGRLAAICDHRGQPSTVLPSPEATMAAGAHTRDHAVIATPTGYLGFRLR